MFNPNNGSEFARNRARLDDTPNPYEPEVGSLPEGDRSQAGSDTVNKTGTTIVGLTTQDGVLMASDMRASLGGRVISNKNVQKVEEIQPNAALSISGSVGGAQSFIRSLRAEANLYEARRGEYMSIDALSTMASNLLRGGPFFRVVPILGGVDDDGGHVFSLDPAGSSMSDTYTAQGSGMPYALGVLEQEYSEDLTMADAEQVAAHAVKSASERDTASGNGIHITKITHDGLTTVGHKEFDALL
ncbi:MULTISPECIES: archaeal proteasome endopeptidase complex subunit beta [Halobacterium]|uniref:Proteasome subunit beta n=5 Tax=Halobacterium salinarum TaxID=2242 RepID=PSB_HALSA|nr:MULTISPECIES: archaeal proteasome endopeptidase complex subunit beta [Halobacterium]B0R4C8.1 RecName: Full=Proteasome subunit beta; AltName: Full=20S proteasome beta subunit; AltName: Full=Proteasome core protein PsmB; Flags: Precursor [Halobacterium salinarum R1]Q9HR36.2 RecName: Full=Proteasome subunit beta; AltName: Full=20S proteasome beta subunit; AltName: Full=Proteasome core protein PsmB; Flags: Precursor [Halobacterium salinarum NRC-1]MBB6090436.1 proteasome beta subunit [Halobacteriu